MQTKKQRVNIITLGCSKNLVDSEQIGRQLQANDFSVSHEKHTPQYDIAIINTCGFIDSAKEESINTIIEQINLKKNQQIQKVYVTGCLSHRYKSQLQEELPEVDAFFGTMELSNLLLTLGADYKKDLIGDRLLSTPSHYAYLKISEGCNRTCSFCAIPLMRGPHTSRTIENITTEIQTLVQKGVKEFLLVAQELTYYGLDIYKKRTLPLLLETIAAIKGVHWIRLHYAYPSKFPTEILPVIKNHPNICNYLDMPLQHASDDILQKMKRQITQKEIIDLLNTIRHTIPNITLRTTFLIGFPGETQKDFDILSQFVQDQQFDRVGVFQYSHEEGTSAFHLPDSVPQHIKQQRYETLMEIQRQISIKKNDQKINQTLNVLIDKKEGGKYIGRTEADSPEVDNEVVVQSPTPLKIGNFYPVKITNAFDYDLLGVVQK